MDLSAAILQSISQSLLKALLRDCRGRTVSSGHRQGTSWNSWSGGVHGERLCPKLESREDKAGT